MGPNDILTTLSEIWRPFFFFFDPLGGQLKHFNLTGYFHVNVTEKITVVSLNSLLFWKNDPASPHPCSDASGFGSMQLVWLESILKMAKFHNRQVLIIGHVPPSEWKTPCTQAFLALYEQYSRATITGLIFGHLHSDHIFPLNLTDVGTNRTLSNKTVAVAYSAPSVVPSFNPSVRLYHLSPDPSNTNVASGIIRDWDQFYFPLNDNVSVDPKLEFKLEYSPLTAYNLPDLSVDSWSQFFAYIAQPEGALMALRYQKHSRVSSPMVSDEGFCIDPFCT